MKRKIPTVIGVKLALFVSVSAKRKSPQPARDENNAAGIIAVRLIGTTIDQKIVQWPAPSTRAASDSSPGIFSMKARITIMAKGTALVESARTTATGVLIRCRRLNMAYSEFATTKPGAIWARIRATSRNRPILDRIRASE